MTADATPKSALITGGAGFIGSHLAELLLDAGWEVFVLDDLSTGSERERRHLTRTARLPPDRRLRAQVVGRERARPSLRRRLPPRRRRRRPPRSSSSRCTRSSRTSRARRTSSTTATGSASACSSRRPRRSTATAASRRRSTRRACACTGRRRRAAGRYAESKALDEFLALAYHQERGLDCVIVRLFNTVGPRQSGQYGMVIPRFVSAALAGRAARDPRRRHADALLLPRAGHDRSPRRR